MYRYAYGECQGSYAPWVIIEYTTYRGLRFILILRQFQVNSAINILSQKHMFIEHLESRIWSIDNTTLMYQELQGFLEQPQSCILKCPEY